MTMRKINYKSDFDFILRLYSVMVDADGKEVDGSKTELGWPDYDWTARIYTSNKVNAYVASSVGGVLTNCYNDDGRIHIVVDNHRMGLGKIIVEFCAELPREIYPDGYQRNVIPEPLDIELIKGKSDLPTEMEAEVLLPYIKGKKGDKMTYADLTDEDKKDLIKPVEEKIDKAITGKQDKLTPTEDLQISEDNIIGLTDVAKMRLFCDLFNAAAGDAGYARITDDGFDCKLNELKLTYEEAVEVYEAGRFTESAVYGFYAQSRICTNLPPYPGHWSEPVASLTFCFSSVEVANVANGVTAATLTFGNCSRLRKIVGRIVVSNTITNAFQNSPELESMDIVLSAKSDISLPLQDSPLINLQSFQYMVTNKTGNFMVVIIVHPDVYAKLTDESNTEWNAVLNAAAEKNINFATI